MPCSPLPLACARQWKGPNVATAENNSGRVGWKVLSRVTAGSAGMHEHALPARRRQSFRLSIPAVVRQDLCPVSAPAMTIPSWERWEACNADLQHRVWGLLKPSPAGDDHRGLMAWCDGTYEYVLWYWYCGTVVLWYFVHASWSSLAVRNAQASGGGVLRCQARREGHYDVKASDAHRRIHTQSTSHASVWGISTLYE